MTILTCFVKYPEPGKVKTRLGAEIGYEMAAELYRIFIEQTFQLLEQSAMDAVLVAYSPESKAAEFSEMVPPQFELFPQHSGTLGERLVHAFSVAFERGADRVLAFGSDSPTVPPEHVKKASTLLDNCDLVLGPSQDGGYYLIGMKQPEKLLFEGIAWSSSEVLQQTIDRAGRLDLEVKQLPLWYDVDDRETLHRAARDDKSGAIAKLVAQIEVCK